MLKLFSMIKSRLLKAHENNRNNSIYDSNNPLPPQPSCKEIQTEWEAWMMRKGCLSNGRRNETCSTSSLMIMEDNWATAGINIFGQFPLLNSPSPLVDLCVNRSQVGVKKVEMGDMELGGGHNNGSVGGISTTQFKTIDEVQSMIRHLQKIEQDMKKKDDGCEGNQENSLVSFESLSLLDERECGIDENETEWLTKVTGSKKMTAKDLEGDESFIDSGLLNVRHGLLNFVKSVVIEEKATKFNTSPRYHPPAQSNHHHNNNNTVLNSNTFCRRKTPPSPLNTTVPLRAMSPPTVYHTYSPKRPALAGLLAQHQEGRLALAAQEARLALAQDGGGGSNENSPVSSSSANRSSFEFLSPNAQKPVREDRNDLVEANLYFSTPAVKQIDSRTYTRPKKNRLPLETYHDDLLPVSPIKPAGLEEEVQLDDVVEPFEMDTNHHHHHNNHHQNMNETFVAEEDIVEETHLVHHQHHHHHNHHKAQEESPPRRVTRNLSYVIRRESESPNNNSSPVHPSSSENIENIAVVDLNSTFVRTREGTYSPSPTGSNTSIHTSSMEELHNLARIQEQSLRMSSNPKMLTRKDTQTLVRGSEQPTLRPINKPPMESSGIPSQPKLRIQSRIPALGAAGSRIRPPVNGATRRPITSGGIRRAPDWRDDGAY